jgi:hypothetical protein
LRTRPSPEQAEPSVKPGTTARGAVGVGRRADVAGILLLRLIARADHRIEVGRRSAGLKASRMILPSAPGPTRIPLLASTRISLMPDGTRNGTAGLSASATFRKSATIGAASPPPVAQFADVPRLVVAHIDADGDVGRIADKPDVLLVVGGAGLAAIGLPTERTTVAVPRCTTPSMIEVIW